MAIVSWPQSLRRHFPRVWHLVSCRTTVEFSQEHAAFSQRSNQYGDISRGRPPEDQTCGPGPSWAPSALSDLELVKLAASLVDREDRGEQSCTSVHFV